jgi:hypothetical protein
LRTDGEILRGCKIFGCAEGIKAFYILFDIGKLDQIMITIDEVIASHLLYKDACFSAISIMVSRRTTRLSIEIVLSINNSVF